MEISYAIGFALHIASITAFSYRKQSLPVADGFSVSALSKHPKAICAISASLSHISPELSWIIYQKRSFLVYYGCAFPTVSSLRALLIARTDHFVLTADLLIQPYTYDTPPPWGVIVVIITPNKVFVKNFSRLQMQAAGAYAV